MNYTIAAKHLITLGKKINSIVCTLFLSLIVTSSALGAEDRFSPPSFDSSLEDFNRRFSTDTVNINFVVAQVLNNVRLIERGAESIRENALLFRNQNGDSSTNYQNSSTGATSGSVIIPPGTSADTIIIINQVDGDSYAIQR